VLWGVLYNLAESLRIIAILISPFMPQIAEKILKQLNITLSLSESKIADIKEWGKITVDNPIGEISPLFPKVEE
jgi:methionyl-tRNA synthetase